MLQALSNHSEGKRLDTGNCLVSVLTVGHDTGQGGDLGQPAAIVFPLNFNRERHEGNVPSGPLTRRWTRLRVGRSRPARRRSSPQR